MKHKQTIFKRDVRLEAAAKPESIASSQRKVRNASNAGYQVGNNITLQVAPVIAQKQLFSFTDW